MIITRQLVYSKKVLLHENVDSTFLAMSYEMSNVPFIVLH